MARKVFLSFLGTSNYDKSIYFSNESQEIETRFVQIASIKFHCSDFSSYDSIYLFTTDKAKSQNWENFIWPSKTETIGLKQELEYLNIPPKIESVWIPEETSEEKIWETFNIVYNKINTDDEIVFDITHGFRSSPLLLMVLINYAMFLKNVSVRKIIYGAYEARDKENNKTKIWDLTNFAVLQDWTSAANEIINFGNANKISNMTIKELAPVLKEAKGKDKSASALNQFAKNIKNLSEIIATNRGKELLEGEIIKNLKKNLSEIENIFITPLVPIIDRLKLSLLGFKEYENISNAFSAVNWCINNNLVQQGITILLEAINSFICLKMNLDYTIEKHRNIINSCFSIFQNNICIQDWKGDAGKDTELTEKILKNDFLKLLVKDFSKLTQLRNDINHAGFKKGSITQPEKFGIELKGIYCNVISKLTGEF